MYTWQPLIAFFIAFCEGYSVFLISGYVNVVEFLVHSLLLSLLFIVWSTHKEFRISRNSRSLFCSSSLLHVTLFSFFIICMNKSCELERAHPQSRFVSPCFLFLSLCLTRSLSLSSDLYYTI